MKPKHKNYHSPSHSNHSHDGLVLMGRKVFRDTINDPFLCSRIQRIFLTASQKHLIQLCHEHHLGVEIVSKAWFSKRFGKQNHQYCCLYIYSRPQISLTKLIQQNSTQTHSLILLLDQVQDPHNFGAILRTAVAANVAGVIVKNHNQVGLTPAVLKVSAGAGLLIDVVSVANLNAALEQLKKAGYWSYGALLGPNTQQYDQIIYAPKAVLIVGNGGAGISPLLATKTDFKISIPMIDQIDSLNVAVATGILIYQMRK